MNLIMQLSVNLIFLLLTTTQASFHCDFESRCEDFILDDQWGLTDGEHPILIDHDHTRNTSAGHYIFYQPTDDQRVNSSEIRMKDWFEPSGTVTMCFSMWYFSRDEMFSFTIQLIQGDDEQLSRVFKEISYVNQSMNDWTEMKIVLPIERFKLALRLNGTREHLVFDDLFIDFCDLPQPPIPKVLFFCDFESSCSDKFVSLPFYPYQWQVIQAGQPPELGGNPPQIDFTFANKSGHYVWVNNFRRSQSGRVGYYGTQQAFYIQQNQSYCLNFEYFQYNFRDATKLKVYAWMSDSNDAMQLLWPPVNSETYSYSFSQWSWAIINLPIGYYRLLFRIETTPNVIFPGSFTLDNIGIVSCDYPSYSLSPMSYTYLSFSCDFDDMSSCGMANGNRSFPSLTYNFSVITGDRVPKPNLGPNRDHTHNSTIGGFIYWNQTFPLYPAAKGLLTFQRFFEQTTGLCIQFAYYIRSLLSSHNATNITLFSTDNPSNFLWTQSLDDSQGWQSVTLAFPQTIIRNEFYFSVNQSVLADVSVAFDDISIQQCDSYPIVTTTTTMTSTTTSVTTTTTTTTTSSSTTTTTVTTMSTTSTISTTSTTATTTTTSSSSSKETTTSTTVTTPNTTGTGTKIIDEHFSIIFSILLSIFVLTFQIE